MQLYSTYAVGLKLKSARRKEENILLLQWIGNETKRNDQLKGALTAAMQQSIGAM